MIPTRKGSSEWTQCGVEEKRPNKTRANTIGGHTHLQITVAGTTNNHGLHQYSKQTGEITPVPLLEGRVVPWRLIGLEDLSSVTIVAKQATSQETAMNQKGSIRFEQ